MGAAEREGKEVKLDIIQDFCRKTTIFFLSVVSSDCYAKGHIQSDLMKPSFE